MEVIIKRMIYRAKNEKGKFTTVHKDLIDDNSLSAHAKGIMIYLLSQSENWRFYETEIAKHFNDGVKGISRGIKELIDKGYIERTKHRNNKGHYVYEYDIFETIKVRDETP